MRSLLDINVLIALLDRDHIDHERAREWLRIEIANGWASCAITQNGFVRIVSQPRYPGAVSPTVAMDRLAKSTATQHHEFWPCNLSVLEENVVDRMHIHGPRQVTDAYLLALAVHHQGRFVTFDRSVPLSGVRTATAANLVVVA